MKDLLNDTGLGQQDDVIYTAKLHWISYVKPVLSIIIGTPLLLLYLFLYWNSYSRGFHIPEFRFENLLRLLIPMVLFYVILKGALGFLYNKMTKIYLTHNYLTLRTGILSKGLDDIALSKYEGIRVYQSWLGRILNYGILAISTGEIVQAYQIEKPLALRKHILKQRANL